MKKLTCDGLSREKQREKKMIWNVGSGVQLPGSLHYVLFLKFTPDFCGFQTVGLPGYSHLNFFFFKEDSWDKLFLIIFKNKERG